MAFTKIGINFDGLQDIEPLNIETPSTAEGFIQQGIDKANEFTNGYLGLMVSSTMFLYLVYTLTDTSEFGSFRYSYIRGIGIAASIVSIFGILALIGGIFNNFYHIVIFMTISLLATIWEFKESVG